MAAQLGAGLQQFAQARIFLFQRGCLLQLHRIHEQFLFETGVFFYQRGMHGKFFLCPIGQGIRSMHRGLHRIHQRG